VALLFIASILLHELGHTMASLSRGIGVRAITLFALGGVTESTSPARSAKDEFVVVGIGPFISLVLAAAFGLLWTAARDVPVVNTVSAMLAVANLALAIFNIVPAYPLDGGRLLRSVFWAITRRPHQSTRWAARVGQVFAVALIALSVWQLLGPGDGFGDLWTIFIALFLLRGASDAHRQSVVREKLDRRSVRDVMGSVPPALAPDLPLDAALAQVQLRPSLLWPVGEPLVGGVLLGHIDAVAVGGGPSTTVASVAVPAERVTIDVTATLDDAVARMADAPGQMLIVTEAGRPVGLLTLSLVADLLG
jgi:Zn-dependent protease/CBS domain-containing protein